ncbi:metallophosphoesterase family protein [Geitlerinema sp. PCC 9228]|uniref:metallophosphoesterase family protein n=1 Tax=Geitlerinema sp. PCC 9228 TaxID=111611 RepID=UPI0008F9857B|nr:metallophosphoesterase family protein [Geitlerinema sp. PCC 9228]
MSVPTIPPSSGLLSDPFLQLPTQDSVRVVWFTEFPGVTHTLTYGDSLEKKAAATTQKLTRTREDRRQSQQGPKFRDIWRHEAQATDLSPNRRVPYYITSIREDGRSISSRQFTLSPLPPSGKPVKILLTSDHQQKPMTAANLQKVAETVSPIDAVLVAGDLVNVPDRASEWFDDSEGGAFFPCLQGNASYRLEKNGTETTYTGGELIQHVPLYTAIGNHEVMGRFSGTTRLNAQFNDAFPQAIAQKFYQQKAKTINPRQDPKVANDWIKANSYNTDTYEEILTLPQSIPGGKKYYATTFGDIRLVVLYATNIWRKPSLNPNTKGKYRERESDFQNPENWGYGQIIFEPIAKGSQQYKWLKKELQSQAFQQAKHKIVMFHHPPHSLGDNIVPPYTDPEQIIKRDESGNITSIRYEYPPDQDYLIRDVVPLLELAGVDLVYFGHSHVWNRFQSQTTHYLESSNVGNTYGAYFQDKKRNVPKEYRDKYTLQGDPNGLEPIVPTIAPLTEDSGENNQQQPLPYIASNDITVFSVLDTGTQTVSSYYFDTRTPNSHAVKFDEFSVEKPKKQRDFYFGW